MSETDVLPSSLGRHVDHMCDCFESSWKAWQSGERPRIPDFSRNARRALIAAAGLLIHYRGSRQTQGGVPPTFPSAPEWLADGGKFQQSAL